MKDELILIIAMILLLTAAGIADNIIAPAVEAALSKIYNIEAVK